ncbi:MAG TPA: Mut7-C RNAse domain-containing protein [Burkholderiales bacterium]|nr:Mut7-C RNAse domain-containing protein [Burkholderiales bacterium]
MTHPAASAEFRFYEELNDFLPPERRKVAFNYSVAGTRSVKDAIESIGVPHTEVDLILVDGSSVGFDRVLRGGERVAVYPVFERLDITPLQHLRPLPLREPCFVLDCHLGKLARHLRLLGFDCLYRNDYRDYELITAAVAERRIILTRDLGLLKQRLVTHGYYVRETNSEAQLREVIRALQLESSLRPFTRCRECNAELRDVPKSEVLARLPEKVRAAYERFQLCPGCGRIYWEGTHYERLRRLLDPGAQPDAAAR